MPDPVIVAGQNYTVRKGESPFSIARTLLGRGATESQVAAFVQGQDWLRTLHPGEVLTVRPSEVMADAVPSANFMKVANAVTEAGGHKLPSNVTPTGVTSQDLVWSGGRVVGVRGGLDGATPGQQAAQQQVAVQTPVKTPTPYAAQLARGPLGQPIPQPDFGIPQHSSRLIGAYAGSQVGVNRSVQNAQAGVKASPPAGALPIATQQLMANPAAFWGGPAAGPTAGPAAQQQSSQQTTLADNMRRNIPITSENRYMTPVEARAADFHYEAVQKALQQVAQNPQSEYPEFISATTASRIAGLNEAVLAGLYIRQPNGDLVLDPTAAAYASAAESYGYDGYIGYGAPNGVYSAEQRPRRGGAGAGGSTYASPYLPDAPGAINWRIGFG